MDSASSPTLSPLEFERESHPTSPTFEEPFLNAALPVPTAVISLRALCDVMAQIIWLAGWLLTGWLDVAGWLFGWLAVCWLACWLAGLVAVLTGWMLAGCLLTG